MKKIIVIQSVYINDSPIYLSQSINSILNQDYSFFDYYIIVDGPIGESLKETLSSFHDSRMTLIYNKYNKGLARVLNELLEYCKKGDYEYIARMDSDDIAISSRFSKQITYLEQNINVDVVGGAVSEIDENGFSRGKITSYPCMPDKCRAFFAKRNPLAHPTVMFRRSFFDKVDWAYPTDYERNEDTRLWHEGYKHGCVIANIPDVVLYFRLTDNMFKHRRNGKKFAKSQLKLRKEIKRDLNYGIIADVYAYAMYVLMLSPSWMLKAAYRILR